MALSIDKLTPKQLDELTKRIVTRKEKMRLANIARVKTQLKEILAREGLSHAEVFPPSKVTVATKSLAPMAPPAPIAKKSVKKKAPAKKPLPFKYEHSKDKSLKWSGHGKRPAWFVDLITAGAKPDDLLIKKVTKK